MIFNVVVPRCPISIPPVFGGGGGRYRNRTFGKNRLILNFPNKYLLLKTKQTTIKFKLYCNLSKFPIHVTYPIRKFRQLIELD